MARSPFADQACAEQPASLTITRRRLLGTLPALCAGLVALPRLAFAQGPGVRAYHDASAADHQKQFDAPDGLLKKGYRIRSLSVYRNAGATLYAAVWIDVKGPAWRAFHGLSPSDYQAYFNDATSKGFRPTIITATGGGTVGGNQTNTSTFAGVFEQDATPFVAKHGIDGPTFRDTCDWARQHQHVLECATIYGGMNRLHAGVWERAPNVKWDYKITAAIDGPDLAIPLTMPGNDALRLAYVTRSPFGEYLTVYRSDVPVGQSIVKGGMTSSQYQTQFTAITAKGLMPVCVQAGGDPRVGPPVFAALFRKHTIKLAPGLKGIESQPRIER